MKNQICDFLGKVKLNKFQQYILVRPNYRIIQIFLEDAPSYDEWIKGEGGDISLSRAIDNDRVVGATLPLRKFKGKILVETFN